MCGNAILGFTATLAGLAAGAALASWARSRWRVSWESSIAAIIAGTLGLAIPHFIRFIGLNTGSPLLLYAPLHDLSDVGVQLIQPALSVAAWALMLALSDDSWEPADHRISAARWAMLAVPCAAAWLAVRLGPTLTVVLINGSLVVWGASKKIRAWRSAGGLQGAHQLQAKLLGVCLLGALWLGVSAGHPFADTWLNRLNAAYPGGGFLALDEGGPQALGVYQFSTGLKILVRDGVVDSSAGIPAKHEGHLPLMTHPAPRRVLLVGALQPATWNAAACYAAQVDVLDEAPPSDKFRLAIEDGKPSPAAGLSFVRAPGKDYDVILLELPVPTHSPEAARMITRESLRAWRRRLAPNGLLAVRLPIPYFGITTLRIIRTIRGEFNWAGAFHLPGILLVLASDVPIAAGTEHLLARLTPAILRDDPDLQSYLKAGSVWRYFERSEPPIDALPPETADRSRNALPFWEILTAPAPRN